MSEVLTLLRISLSSCWMFWQSRDALDLLSSLYNPPSPQLVPFPVSGQPSLSPLAGKSQQHRGNPELSQSPGPIPARWSPLPSPPARKTAAPREGNDSFSTTTEQKSSKPLVLKGQRGEIEIMSQFSKSKPRRSEHQSLTCCMEGRVPRSNLGSARLQALF